MFAFAAIVLLLTAAAFYWGANSTRFAAAAAGLAGLCVLAILLLPQQNDSQPSYLPILAIYLFVGVLLAAICAYVFVTLFNSLTGKASPAKVVQYHKKSWQTYQRDNSELPPLIEPAKLATCERCKRQYPLIEAHCPHCEGQSSWKVKREVSRNDSEISELGRLMSIGVCVLILMMVIAAVLG